MVQWVRFGLGWNVGGNLFLFEGLKSCPSVLRKVVDHERGHGSGDWSLKDAKHDFFHTRFDREVLWFMLKHPLTWVQLSPLVRLGGTWFVERTVALGWLMVKLVMVFCWAFYHAWTGGLI